MAVSSLDGFALQHEVGCAQSGNAGELDGEFGIQIAIRVAVEDAAAQFQLAERRTGGQCRKTRDQRTTERLVARSGQCVGIQGGEINLVLPTHEITDDIPSVTDRRIGATSCSP